MSLTSDQMSNKFLEQYQKFDSLISHNKRDCDKNFSVRYNNKVFAYLDFVKGDLIARLRLNPQSTNLSNFQGLWRNCTKKSEIGSWGRNENSVTEILMDDENNINLYIKIFEISRKVNQ